MRLVLFDIDGTLLNGGALWREIFEAAFSKVFPGLGFPKVAFSGKTDRQICAEVLSEIGWQPGGGNREQVCEQREQVIDQLIGVYLRELETVVLNGRAGREIEVFSGVRELLTVLALEPRVQLGLLTGNVKEGARLKLAAAGLDRFFVEQGRFRAGAFGDDHADRYMLPTIAVQRAAEELGVEFKGKQVIIIGDTSHDVNCGKSIGVCSIAMGTGNPIYRDALLAAEPDHYFEDFLNRAGLCDAIINQKITLDGV